MPGTCVWRSGQANPLRRRQWHSFEDSDAGQGLHWPSQVTDLPRAESSLAFFSLRSLECLRSTFDHAAGSLGGARTWHGGDRLRDADNALFKGKSRENTALLRCLLPGADRGPADASHELRVNRDAGPASRCRIEREGDLRRGAVRRRRARRARVLRPPAARTRGQRPCVRRLSYGHGPFPALACKRRGEVPTASVAAAMESERR